MYRVDSVSVRASSKSQEAQGSAKTLHTGWDGLGAQHSFILSLSPAMGLKMFFSPMSPRGSHLERGQLERSCNEEIG